MQFWFLETIKNRLVELIWNMFKSGNQLSGLKITYFGCFVRRSVVMVQNLTSDVKRCYLFQCKVSLSLFRISRYFNWLIVHPCCQIHCVQLLVAKFTVCNSSDIKTNKLAHSRSVIVEVFLFSEILGNTTACSASLFQVMLIAPCLIAGYNFRNKPGHYLLCF